MSNLEIMPGEVTRAHVELKLRVAGRNDKVLMLDSQSSRVSAIADPGLPYLAGCELSRTVRARLACDRPVAGRCRGRDRGRR